MESKLAEKQAQLVAVVAAVAAMAAASASEDADDAVQRAEEECFIAICQAEEMNQCVCGEEAIIHKEAKEHENDAVEQARREAEERLASARAQWQQAAKLARQQIEEDGAMREAEERLASAR